MIKYRVRIYMDKTYEVIDQDDVFNGLFQGSLADCEAWIRLKERNMI